MYPHAERSGLDQQRIDIGYPAIGISVVSIAGWLELSRIFRTNYASDLSFVHLPTLIDPYCSKVGHPSPTPGEHQTLNNYEAPPSNPSGLILAFLALTLRHCRDGIRKCLTPGTLSDGMALSASFASLANHWLVAHDLDKACSRVEGSQVRLMLATYDWSLGRCGRSRLLLSEAISVASDLGILQGHKWTQEHPRYRLQWHSRPNRWD